MRQFIFSAILLTATHIALSQTNYQKEINEQVWKPFITTFTSGDNKGFEAVHSERITRVEIDRNKVKESS